ncbi:site-2 protease family protein [Ralstonia insidiosa]|jgi:hypothetical protein|nr:hypothetical protein [Ralstonia insidiosa]MBA9939267.1 hypothetical protein [Ralstonia insidiosa]MBC9968040.1 site-2 protease family protein [Ralstonia insidiosa]MBX3904397.1 site-2 protease family protein [Ralstonia insidiosa]
MTSEDKKRIVRTLLVEGPLALVFVGWFVYRAVTQEMDISDILSFIVALGVLFIAESFIHESGHIICGLLYGARPSGIQIGYGPAIVLWRDSQVPVSLGLLPCGGYVEFGYLPISRRQRIVMYAGGVAASCVAAIVAWNIIPHHLDWLRTETAMAFGLFIATNLFGTAPKDKYSDGDAIRGLLAYR